jgi:predicted cupin superfamily sugar epimerase
MLTADQLKKLLNLDPLPVEGGFFVEAYRSDIALPKSALPGTYSGDRSLSTAIYYLLTPDTFSALHKLRGVEIFHFISATRLKCSC